MTRPWASQFRDWETVSPAQLDTVLNGIKVYFYQRHDGTIYATTYDFSRFGAECIDIIRVKPQDIGRVKPSEMMTSWSIEKCPVVAEHLKRLQAQ